MKDFSNLEKKVGIKFKDKTLLELAFVHKSYCNETDEMCLHNERLEFLGDAVLELVVTDSLYKSYPDKPEGELTNWRSALVKGKNLEKVAKALNLGEYLFLSRGEEISGGREKSYILANTVEAFIGAIYLDKGYETAKEFIAKQIISLLDEIIKNNLYIDAKSHFQELAQEKLSITPRYELLDDSGPDHNKEFIMGAYLGDELIAEGKGSSKQDAEQDAAGNALKKKGWN